MVDIEELDSVMCKTCGCARKIPPEIPLYGAYNIHLEKDKVYLWCSCGLGKNQPFCDGSCAKTGFKPIEFKVEKQQSKYSICGCKYSKNPPYCDATHTEIDVPPIDPPCNKDHSL